jgi:hypothetical protein
MTGSIEIAQILLLFGIKTDNRVANCPKFGSESLGVVPRLP